MKVHKHHKSVATYAWVIVFIILLSLSSIIYIVKHISNRLSSLSTQSGSNYKGKYPIASNDTGSSQSTSAPQAAPTATPVPLPAGKQTYFVQSSGPNPTAFTQLVVDPLDAKSGNSQNWTIVTTKDANLSSVTVTAYLDSGIHKFDLVHTPDNTWTKSWQMPDNTFKRFQAEVTAKTDTGLTSSFVATFR